MSIYNAGNSKAFLIHSTCNNHAAHASDVFTRWCSLGKTALRLAIDEKHNSVVEYLISVGGRY